jgi:hypothetical protein
MALCFTSSTGANLPKEREMRPAFMSIEEAFLTYSEGMTLEAKNTELGDFGACRRW